VARQLALFPVLAMLFFLAPLTPPAWAAEAKEPLLTARTQPPDPGSQHASVVRSGTMSTKDGLTLRLTTDLGSVNIIQLEAGAAPVVRYTVHIETDARGVAAQQLLDAYALKSKAISSGVEITGMLPPQAVRSADAQFWVQFEVAVPRGYSIDVNTEGGDIHDRGHRWDGRTSHSGRKHQDGTHRWFGTPRRFLGALRRQTGDGRRAHPGSGCRW